MKKWKKIMIAIIIVIAVIALLPYAKTEFLTLRYGKEFEGLEQQTSMLNEARYHKVFSYGKNQAEVFYASDTGDMITFCKDDNGEWQMQNWETVWSRSGSAEGFIWPCYF